MKTIFITGASSGIGKATAKLFANKGWQVIATMRNPEKETELAQIDKTALYALDVTNKEQIESTVTQVLTDFDSVDVVLNNAGYGLMGVFEATCIDQIQRQFQTNLFGLMEITRAFLPHYRKKKSGLFINVSSVGGFSTYPFTSLYHASKWAVEGFSESLSYELRELGIQIKLIEPGAVKTDLGSRSMEIAMPNNFPDYGESVQKFMSAMQSLDRTPATSEIIAKGIYDATVDGKSQLRYPLGDGQEIFDLRKKLGDDGFIEMTQSKFFG